METEYNPLNHLGRLLLMRGIPFEDADRAEMGQLLYPSRADRRCSIIFGPGSIGYENGNLEIQGLLTDVEAMSDSVAGNLTVIDVLVRITRDWKYYEEEYEDEDD